MTKRCYHGIPVRCWRQVVPLLLYMMTLFDLSGCLISQIPEKRVLQLDQDRYMTEVLASATPGRKVLEELGFPSKAIKVVSREGVQYRWLYTNVFLRKSKGGKLVKGNEDRTISLSLYFDKDQLLKKVAEGDQLIQTE